MMVYRVRISDETKIDKELEAIDRFYKSNSDKGNRVRDPLILMKSVKDRSFYIVEDHNKHIIAVAACFQFFEKHKEVGGTRVIKNGYGIQKLLLWCRSVNELIMSPPKETYFSVVADWNLASIKSIKKCGFKKWDPDDTFLREIGYTSVRGAKQGKFFFKIDFDRDQRVIQNHAQNLIRTYKKGKLSHSGAGKSIDIVLDFPLMRNGTLRQIVEKLSKGEIRVPF